MSAFPGPSGKPLFFPGRQSYISVLKYRLISIKKY